MDTTTTLALFAVSVYWLRALLMAWGAWRERRTTSNPATMAETSLPLVSIVIPARNEQHRIGRCLESLIRVKYPPELLEIIVVNDRSTDDTHSVVSLYMERMPLLRLVDVHQGGSGNLRGKAGALDEGIRQARGSIVLLTDADCAVHPLWVHAHVALYANPQVGMVCGYTLIDGSSLFANYQAVEWNTTHTMASAGVHYRQYLGCFGNNMSIRRSVYTALGGYAAIPFSVTEDLALLQAVGAQGWQIRYVCSLESSVETEPCQTLREYLLQHQRWVHGAKRLGWRAYMFVISTVAYWIGMIAALLNLQWGLAMGIVSMRIGADYLLNTPPMLRLHRHRLLWWIAPTSLLFGVLELCLPFLALTRSIRWKDQIFPTSEPAPSISR